MPSTTWMQRAVASEATARKIELWRAVEAQHRATTLRLTDSIVEHELLEQLIDDAKPRTPPSAVGLDYLLATPFRYPSPHGSRFRAPTDRGVWYGAIERRTALAEVGYWRWRFARAAKLEIPSTPQTVLAARVAGRATDLTRGTLAKHRREWTLPDNYAPTQALRRVCDGQSIELILYESVRDPEHKTCGAVLTPKAFATKRPTAQETWSLSVLTHRVVWTRGADTIEFRQA